MKNRHHFQNQTPASALPPSPTTNKNQTNKNNGESASVKPQALIEKPSQTSIAVKPPRDEVAAVAYQIYLQEGCPQGCELQHWLEAEAQLAAVPPVTLKTEVGPPAKTNEPGIKVPVEFQH